ncbi:MAG: tetratricopeptide repeat protein [Balneolales bacterium]
MKRLCIAITILSILPLTASAQSESLLLNEDFIADARQAIDSVYNLNYEASLDILQPWREARPEHPVWAFWPAIELWWKILPDLDNTGYDKAFFELLDEAKQASEERLDDSDIDALIIKSMSYGFSARHWSNREAWYRSLRHAQTAMAYFREIGRRYPDLGDIQFGLGMSRYFSAFFADHYPVIRPFAWLLPKGDKEDGLKRLGVAAANSTFMIPEATFFLGHIYLHYERDFPRAVEYLGELTRRYPNNGYYRRLLIRAHYRNHNHYNTLALIDSTLAKWKDKIEIPDLALKEELHLLKGSVLAFRGNKDGAIQDFLAAFQIGDALKPQGHRQNYIKASYHLGEIYLEREEHETARYFLEIVAASNLEFDYVDRAKNHLRREF